jgi:CheY-like chemotaxis protein
MKKILLVEDEEFIRELYEYVFKKKGYTVETAPDGNIGKEKILNNHDFDVILLDIMLPFVDGVSLLEIIRKKELENNTNPSKVVMLTNLGDEHVYDRCKALGVQGFLIKARLNPQQVVEEVERIIKENQVS